MAIQMRRGNLANYDKSKMLAGEWGISVDQDTERQKAFVAFAPGVDKEVLFVEDAENIIAGATSEAIEDATEEAKGWARGNSFHVNDYGSGDGSTTAFTLSYTPTSIQAVYVDGEAVSSYTQSGTTITFSTAPPLGTNNVRVAYTVSTATDNAKYYKEQAATSASNASNSATSASNNALKSEGYAVGKQNGTDVGSGSDYYHNNAKYYKEEAASSASAAADGEAWAVGKRGGTDVPPTDPTYHNNAKYYKEQAEAAAAMLDAPKILGDFAHYESTTTASKAYSAGDLLTYNGYLYRATAAIANGGTIVTSGASANVEGTDVATELERIFSGVLGIPIEADHTSMTAAHSAGEYVYSEGHLYRLLKNLAIGTAIVSGTGTSWDSAEEVSINSDLATERLWFKDAPVSATTGTIVDITDARITKQHVLAEIHWGDSSYITALTDWSTDTAGHFIITGTASAATTVTVLLVRAVTKDLSS